MPLDCTVAVTAVMDAAVVRSHQREMKLMHVVNQTWHVVRQEIETPG